MAVQWRFPTIFVAAASLVQTPLGAAPIVMTQMGATSKASIEIRVSVAPRMGVNRVKEAQPYDARGRRDRALCVWSSAPLRTYTVHLQALPNEGPRASAAPDAAHHLMSVRVASGLGLVNLAPGKAVEAIAFPSAAACGRISGMNDLSAQDLQHGSAVPALLILAPE